MVLYTCIYRSGNNPKLNLFFSKHQFFMNKYLEAPAYFVDPRGEILSEKCVFLAGSITGAENWQIHAKELLLPHYHVINPRRAEFDVTNPAMEDEQICWEFKQLNWCGNILFWFSGETLAPIALLEYGKILTRLSAGVKTRVAVGVHPDYKRKNDVIIQTRLERPNLIVHSSLDVTIGALIGNLRP
jgi:hypothetical protein